MAPKRFPQNSLDDYKQAGQFLRTHHIKKAGLLFQRSDIVGLLFKQICAQTTDVSKICYTTLIMTKLTSNSIQILFSLEILLQIGRTIN